MTPARPLLLLALLAASIAGAVTVPSVGESRLIRQRIDELLLRRRNPAPLPVDPPSPFVVLANPAGALTPAAAEPPPVRRVETPGNAEQLARLASRLRITGLIRIKDQLHVIINDSPWKDGDYIALETGTGLLQLQILRVQAGQLTMRLGEAELVMRF